MVLLINVILNFYYCTTNSTVNLVYKCKHRTTVVHAEGQRLYPFYPFTCKLSHQRYLTAGEPILHRNS